MRKFFILILLLLSSLSLNAETLPLFTDINLPNSSKGNIQEAINQLLSITEDHHNAIEAGTAHEAAFYFSEYHSALIGSNQSIAAQLPDSIYSELLLQFHKKISSISTQSYIYTYAFLTFQAKSFGAELPEDHKKWNDDILIRGLSYLADNKNINAYNIYFYLNNLNDKSRKFELILNVLFVYQVQFRYEENHTALGAKFSELLKMLLDEVEIGPEEEDDLLDLSFNLNDARILKWYKKAKIPFNFSLGEKPSIFCYSVIGLLQRHMDTPEYVTEEDVLKRIEAFMSYGANLNASCDTSNLKSTLDRWSFNQNDLLPIVNKIYTLFLGTKTQNPL